MNRVFLTAFLAASTVASASAVALESSSGSIDPSTQTCAANFTATGSFIKGKQFRTFEEFPNTTPSAAYSRLVSAIASKGYQIVDANRDTGTISANQTVSFGEGKTVPLNVIIGEISKKGSRVEAVMTVSAGLLAPKGQLQKELCEIVGKAK